MTSLLVAAAVALAAWTWALLRTGAAARARRPEPPSGVSAGPAPEPADPALRRLLDAVRRHGGGDRLRAAVLAAALEGLLGRDAVRIDEGPGGPWVHVADATPAGLAPHELALLEHLRAADARATGPVPLAALRPTRGVRVDRAWLAGLVAEAVAWAGRGGHLRELVDPGVRTRLWVGFLVPVGLLTAAVLVAVHPGQEAALAAVAWALLLGSVVGHTLTGHLDGYGLTAAADRALAAPAPGPPAPPRPAVWRAAGVLTTSGRRSRAWSSADETWREVRVGSGPTASRAREPRTVRTENLTLVLVMAALAVALVVATPMALRGGGVSTVFLLLWWGAWLRVTPPAALRLSRALSDLRTGPVAWTGQVVQRRTVESESYGPESSTDTLPVLALDVGGGQVRLLVVDDDVHRRMPPGTLVRALVTPRLCHLVSVEAVPTPGGVGLPPAGPGPARA